MYLLFYFGIEILMKALTEGFTRKFHPIINC